jgi:hypothetical protein
MNKGWQKGLVIYVYLKKRYIRGTLQRKKGSKWLFKPEKYKKIVSVCPIRNKWRYNFKRRFIKWNEKISILMAGEKPFKLCRERFNGWTGAKTCRTQPVKMQVWQIAGTSEVYVGHLGRYTLALIVQGKLIKMLEEPEEQHFFIGRGVLDARKFKCLKVVPLPFQRDVRKKKPALYPIPTREELGMPQQSTEQVNSEEEVNSEKQVNSEKDELYTKIQQMEQEMEQMEQELDLYLNNVVATNDNPNESTKKEKRKKSSTTKKELDNMPQKKRGKYRKLESKKMTEPEEKIFNEWFDKFCLNKVEEPVIRTVCIQLRKNAPNSYESYCESVHAKPVGLKQFNAAIKKKTGSVPEIRHMRKLAFDNIQFRNL